MTRRCGYYAPRSKILGQSVRHGRVLVQVLACGHFEVRRYAATGASRFANLQLRRFVECEQCRGGRAGPQGFALVLAEVMGEMQAGTQARLTGLA